MEHSTELFPRSDLLSRTWSHLWHTKDGRLIGSDRHGSQNWKHDLLWSLNGTLAGKWLSFAKVSDGNCVGPTKELLVCLHLHYAPFFWESRLYWLMVTRHTCWLSIGPGTNERAGLWLNGQTNSSSFTFFQIGLAPVLASTLFSEVRDSNLIGWGRSELTIEVIRWTIGCDWVSSWSKKIPRKMVSSLRTKCKSDD